MARNIAFDPDLYDEGLYNKASGGKRPDNWGKQKHRHNGDYSRARRERQKERDRLQKEWEMGE